MSISLRTSSSWRLPTLAKFPLPPKVIVPIVSAEILRPELPSCRYSIARSFRTSDRSRWLTTILVERTHFFRSVSRNDSQQAIGGGVIEFSANARLATKFPRVCNGRPSLSVELSVPHAITPRPEQGGRLCVVNQFPSPSPLPSRPPLPSPTRVPRRPKILLRARRAASASH